MARIHITTQVLLNLECTQRLFQGSLTDLNWTEQYPSTSNKLVQIITMIRATPIEPEAEPVSIRLFGTEATPPETDPRQTTKTPPDLQDGGCCSSLWTSTREVSLCPKEQDWTSTHTRQTSPEATEEILPDEAPFILAKGAKGHDSPLVERPSSSNVREHSLSCIYTSRSARQRLSSTRGPLVQDNCSPNQTSLRRCQSWLGTWPSHHLSALGRQPRSRRWSVCTSISGEALSQDPAGDTGSWGPILNIAAARRWCEESRETRVADWQQTVTAFGQTWKQRCFAQRQARVWQDNLIKEAIESFWQPPSDFNYVLSVCSFLEGVKNSNLLPHLRRTYTTWRSPEQARLHEASELSDRGDGSLKKNNTGEGMSRDGNSRATASKYPLTIHQNLRIARVCGDVDEKNKEPPALAE